MQDDFTRAIEALEQNAAERGFEQTVELVINLKGLDMNHPDDTIDFFITTPNDMGLDRTICALIGPELSDEANEVCDEVIEKSAFDDMDEREMKDTASEHDFFLAQANIMPDVASAFGRFLGPRGKMPSPNAGSVVPPNADLQPVYDKLQRTLHLTAKENPVVHTIVGKESLDPDTLGDNANFVYEQLLRKLPKEENNIKDMLVKLTMSAPVTV